MRFRRPKLSVAVESPQPEPEPQPRRRNRLSKPPTSKISTSVSSPSIAPSPQEPASRSKNESATELETTGPLSSHPSDIEFRRQIRIDVLGSDISSPNVSMKNDSAWSVAYTVSQTDKQCAETEAVQPQSPRPSVSPVKPQKRTSILLRRLSLQRSTSLHRSISNGRVSSLKSDAPTPSPPEASLDRIVDSPSVPPTRRASFAPGTATRKPSPTVTQDEIQEELANGELEDSYLVDPDDLDWQPPPAVMDGRSGSPADLDYSHLGGLRHGSLQIVNGRASPAFSELSKMSKQLLSLQTPHRDVSSDYGDADEEFDRLALGVRKLSSQNALAGTTEHRDFSWESNEGTVSRIHPLQNVMLPQLDTEQSRIQDQTSMIAKEYIAELPNSPFEAERSISPIGTIRRTRSETSLWRSNSQSSLQKSPSMHPVVSGDLSPVSPLESSPSPSGSVIRRSRATSESTRDRQSFRENINDRDCRPCESTLTWYSSAEPIPLQEEAFQSAVEFQVQMSPSRPQPPRAPEKSDSGYSSSNSLLSVQIAKSMPSAELEALPQMPAATMNPTQERSDPRMAPLGHRTSILKSHRTESNLPTFSNLRPAPRSSSSAPVAAAQADPMSEDPLPKPEKPRKKLQKRRPLSQPPGKIAVVRVQSFEGDSVPDIPSDARENLRIRSQQVPELLQTFDSSSLMKNKASISNLNLPLVEIRFPSPGPEESVDVKRSRPRGRSRPRSWIGRSKGDGERSKRDSGISQVEALAIINGLGTVASSLGSSPYDLTRGDAATESRRRSMMDDQTAAEVARLRSRAVQERDNMMLNRRPSFNDRGGIPGKNLRPASLISDAPPITPEMLQKAYRTSSMQGQISMDENQAPTPPPHSPRPSYDGHSEDNSWELAAPPPPSHSPRPMDINPDPWAPQAAAWKVRRQSASDALRQKSMDSRFHNEISPDLDDEPLYPVIPPRDHHRQTVHAPLVPSFQYQSPPPAQEQHGAYQGHSQFRTEDYFSNGHYAFQSSNKEESAYVRQSRRNSMMSDDCQHAWDGVMQYSDPSPSRPLPSPRLLGSASYHQPSRPGSNAGSTCSFGSNLSPDFYPVEFKRRHPPPSFGRLTGEMGFGYEARFGFGGSAGTRSASGNANTPRKGIPMKASFGMSLGDAPIGIMAR